MLPGSEPDLQRLTDKIATILAGSQALSAQLESLRTMDGDSDAGVLAAYTARLRESVVRPLNSVVALPSGWAGAGPARTKRDAPRGGVLSAAMAGERLWEITTAATRLRAELALSVQFADPRTRSLAEALAEATAALQRLVLSGMGVSGPSDVAARSAELADSQKGVPTGIVVGENGPYLVTGVERVTNYLGEPLPVTPTMALCRCGESSDKPWCDGSHARIGFTGAKDPKRIPDRRDSYHGVALSVLDNRGVCQHSGFCTGRLANVFHAGVEPFVTPSGGRPDEIVDVVRSCPSGALSYAVDGRESREQVDQARRAPKIEVSKDGPYRTVGGLALTDGASHPEPRAAGASREHYALCRCGHSLNKPFCSGMHYYVDFADPEPSARPTLFEWAGGLPALLRMTRLFYTKHAPADNLLAPLFASMAPDHP